MTAPNDAALPTMTAVARTRRFAGLLAVHVRRFWFAWLLLFACFWMFRDNYRLVPNATRSLPQSWFLVHLNEEVSRGDFVSFLAPDNGVYPPAFWWVKRVVGVPGDRLTREGLNYFVNGELVATARLIGLSGRTLAPLQLPPVNPADPSRFAYYLKGDEYFVVGTHPFSFDSRYAPIGLIRREQMKGRAHAIY